MSLPDPAPQEPARKDPARAARGWPTWPWLAVGAVALLTAACAVVSMVQLVRWLIP